MLDHHFHHWKNRLTYILFYHFSPCIGLLRLFWCPNTTMEVLSTQWVLSSRKRSCHFFSLVGNRHLKPYHPGASISRCSLGIMEQWISSNDSNKASFPFLLFLLTLNVIKDSKEISSTLKLILIGIHFILHIWNDFSVYTVSLLYLWILHSQIQPINWWSITVLYYSMPFYLRHLSIHGFWHLQGSWNQIPVDTEGWLSFLSTIFKTWSWLLPQNE